MVLVNTELHTVRKVFDCFLFDGEYDVLLIRLHELNEAVDQFVIIESLARPDGSPNRIEFNPLMGGIDQFSRKIRHVVLADHAHTSSLPMVGEWKQPLARRAAALRSTPDARPDDLILLSDVGEIPTAATVHRMARDHAHSLFHIELSARCYYVNYEIIEWAEPSWTAAATRGTLEEMAPDGVDGAIQSNRIHATTISSGGWHFLHLLNDSRSRSWSPPSLPRGSFSDALSGESHIHNLINNGADPLSRPGYSWAISDLNGLPAWLLDHRDSLRHLFWPEFHDEPRKLSDHAKLRKAQIERPPIIICPHLFDHEPEEIRKKFCLDSDECQHMEIFFWQDTNRIGPERAYEHCWNAFPDRDVIIIHSDMSPLESQRPSHWYDELCRFRTQIPAAGMIACNLLYPQTSPNEPIRVQCAGGIFDDAAISHLHGDLVSSAGKPGVAKFLLDQIRVVDWVTFGGVLIRRELINACGSFDSRYEWAYIMDVDYCFEARLRGFLLVHVPVTLVHEESRTTRFVTLEAPELWKNAEKNSERFYAKWKPFYNVLPSAKARAAQLAL